MTKKIVVSAKVDDDTKKNLDSLVEHYKKTKRPGRWTPSSVIYDLINTCAKLWVK